MTYKRINKELKFTVLILKFIEIKYIKIFKTEFFH